MTGVRHPSVVMLGPSLDSRGGMATVVKGYIDAGIRSICDFEYIETTAPGSVTSKALIGIRAYARFLKELSGYDIVHLHIGAGLSATRKSIFAKTAKRAGKIVVLHEHRGILPDLYRKGGEGFASECRRFYDLADAAVVLSEEWRTFFAENVCDVSKVHVLHNSIIAPVDAPVFNWSERVLFLGHMTEVKGPDVLVRAIPEVLRTHPGCRFAFAGDGDARPFEVLANKLGVRGACEFVGWVSNEDKDALLLDCPIYCQPSRSEGMPMALLEAMGYGRACVATHVGGVPQVIDSGREGLMVEACNHKAIAEAITLFLDSPDEAARFGALARSKVLEDFDLKKNLEKLNDLYMALTAKGAQS